MPVPGHIHDSLVELTQIDPATTSTRHAQLGEPKGRARYKAPVQITAGMRESSAGALMQRPHGVDPSWSGFLVVRRADLERQAPGVTLHVGDRITKIYVGTGREKVVDLHVGQVQPAGHQAGDPTMWFVYYRDMKTQSQISGA